jgi:arginine deiminase
MHRETGSFRAEYHSMQVHCHAEWETLREVVVHRPGIEMFFGLLEPYASLYERAFSRYEARTEHVGLDQTLRHEFGISVIRLKEDLLDTADRNPEIRQRLVEMAEQALCFSGNDAGVLRAKKEFRKNAGALDTGHFFNILLLNPCVDLHAGENVRSIRLDVTERQPLVNLHYMRDQQVVTDKGMVLARMAKPQREREVSLTGFFWEVYGAPILHRATAPATLEGGDFIPMQEFALIGVGERTNPEGVDQLLRNGLGFQEIGIVSQPGHPLLPGAVPDPMITMHLDTYCNVASSGVAIGSVPLLRRARLRVMGREGPGDYRFERETTLYEYLVEKEFSIIGITTLEQLAYASNFLTVRDGTIVAVEVDRVVRDVLQGLQDKAGLEPDRYGALLRQARKDYEFLKREGEFFPHKREVYQNDIDAYPILLRNLTGGYGGAHCMTCAVRRG